MLWLVLEVVFLTRPLAGTQEKYSLSSFGPLVRVQAMPNKMETPAPAHVVNQEFDGVTLVGYDLDPARLDAIPGIWQLENGRQIRVTLYWHVESKIADDRLVSLKLLAADGTLGAQLDRHPVLDAYPTTTWRKGEYITDTYELPVLTDARPGDYMLQATLYDPDSGSVRGQAALAKITLPSTAQSSGPYSVAGLQNALNLFLHPQLGN